jgi:hypothetical protein
MFEQLINDPIEDLIDRAAKALMKQNRRSVRGNMACVYLAPNGDRCAIGHLLRDGEIQSCGNFRGTVVELLDNYHIYTRDRHRIRVLTFLQQAHDRASDRNFEEDIGCSIEAIKWFAVNPQSKAVDIVRLLEEYRNANTKP